MKRLAPIVMMSLCACVIHAGPGPDSFPPAHTASGVTASLVSGNSHVEGELLEVRDSALVILTHDRVIVAPFSTIDSGSFANSHVRVRHRQRPSWDDFESIRLLSRYPQGIPPDARRRIVGDDRFVTRARATTARFQDINVAIAENYVRVGPDFPAMGQHWVRGESIMHSDSTPMPSILTYAKIDGRLTLTGVVYTLVLRPGQKEPDTPPSAQWHDHVGTIDEESLLLDHTHLGGDMDRGEERLAVMHAWVWLPNPAGMFATDNWALPFTRVGVPAPPNASPRAARAVALATCVPYFTRLFDAVGQLDDRESDAVLDALEHSRGVVQGWLDARNPNDPVSSADLARLEKIWTDLADAITGSVSPASAERLARVLER